MQPMASSFDDRIVRAWTSEKWLFDAMFAEGMCFIEGYLPSIDLQRLEVSFDRLAKLPAELDFRRSIWSNESTEEEWTHSYTPNQYRQMFSSEKIVMLHVDYTAPCDGFDLTFKLMIEQLGNVEVIVYRENFLPREETYERFHAACLHLKHLQELFGGPALFLGPDTLNYPEWPDTVPQEWYRLN